MVLAWNWEFQLLTARMGVVILQLLSIPAHLDRNHIILPRLILRVASSCSGTHYLISILALAIPLAYLTLRRIGNQMTLVLFSLVIGIWPTGFALFSLDSGLTPVARLFTGHSICSRQSQ